MPPLPQSCTILKRLWSMLNSAARLVFSSLRYDHITPLLRQLHWLKAAERIDFKLAVFVYKFLYGAAPSHLADELRQLADFSMRRRLRSASSSSLVVRHTRLSNIGHRAFPIAAAHVYKQYTTARNICTVSVHIPQSSEDSPLPALLPLTALCHA